MSKKEKKKGQWGQYIILLGYMVIGAFCGVLFADIGTRFGEQGKSFGELMLMMVLLFGGVFAEMFLQIVIHESGHLVFGLMTGYRFSSFRIGSFILVEDAGKLKLRKFKLAGTGGQCLMAPPDMVDGKIPYVLYNLGGCIFNLAASLLSGLLYFLLPDGSIGGYLALMMAVIGIAFALMNGIPLNMQEVNNDGSNALSLGKNRTALYAFWLQMKINERVAKGARLRDLPEEWFALPNEEGMQNALTATIAVFACNRLLDEHRFKEADALMKRLLEAQTAMVGVHRSLLTCDRIFCRLLAGDDKESLEPLYTKEQRKFMQAMSANPTVLRTQFAYALLAEKDMQGAQKAMDSFEKCARTYPYPNDIQSERELIGCARQISGEK